MSRKLYQAVAQVVRDSHAETGEKARQEIMSGLADAFAVNHSFDRERFFDACIDAGLAGKNSTDN